MEGHLLARLDRTIHFLRWLLAFKQWCFTLVKYWSFKGFRANIADVRTAIVIRFNHRSLFAPYCILTHMFRSNNLTLVDLIFVVIFYLNELVPYPPLHHFFVWPFPIDQQFRLLITNNYTFITSVWIFLLLNYFLRYFLRAKLPEDIAQESLGEKRWTEVKYGCNIILVRVDECGDDTDHVKAKC